MKVYIAGPMRGIPDFNFPAFDAAAARGRALGHEIISPAEMDREVGFEGIGKTGGDEWQEVLGKRQTIQRDIDALYLCDAVALLAGWHKSSGAAVEVALAKFLGLKILDGDFEEIDVAIYYDTI